MRDARRVLDAARQVSQLRNESFPCSIDGGEDFFRWRRGGVLVE